MQIKARLCGRTVGNTSVELWFWESRAATTAIILVYRPTKRLVTLRVIATMLSGGIVANESITNVPWSQINVVASTDATEKLS